MGRIKRGYVREIPDDELKRDYRLFAIACEGSKDRAKGRIKGQMGVCFYDGSRTISVLNQ